MTKCNLQSLRVSDIMNTNLQWADAQENLREAGMRMAETGLRALLVAGPEEGDLPGILTSKDIVSLLCRQDAAILEQLMVRDVMTRPAICVPKQANLLDCLNLMRMSGVRRLPVLDGTTVVGILSTSDVLKHVLSAC